MSDDIRFNVRGIDQLLKATKTKVVFHVGILGDRNSRNGKAGKAKAKTNAEIGAVHEFGSPARNIPARSFLRMPITEKLQKYLEKSGAFSREVLAQVMKEGSFSRWAELVGVTAESVVLDTFDTAGFGQWPAWKDPNYTNNSGQLLVDTKQLRDSISISPEVKG